jgi:hypothetical protein
MQPETPPEQPVRQSGKAPYRNMLDEADIGSGERSPGQHDTDKIVDSIAEDRGDAPDEEARQVGTASSLPDEIEDAGDVINQQRKDAGPRRQDDQTGGLIQDKEQTPPKGN